MTSDRVSDEYVADMLAHPDGKRVIGSSEFRSILTELQHLRSPVTVSDEYRELVDYVLQEAMHNRLVPRVVDIAYSAFMAAKEPNKDDGGASDWFTDTKPMVDKRIAEISKALTAALAPAEQEGESKDQMTVEQRIRLRTKFGGTSDYSKGWNDALEALIGDLSHTPGGDSRS